MGYGAMGRKQGRMEERSGQKKVEIYRPGPQIANLLEFLANKVVSRWQIFPRFFKISVTYLV